MRAIVCDCCGKVVLLEDGPFCPEGINHLSGKICGQDGLDLSNECAEKLIKATKGTED